MGGPDLRALTILIVDDNANMRGILSAILKAAGVRRILEAGDGVEGLKFFAEREIDIIFTDLMMQPVDGLAFVHWVRNSPASPNPYAPIIMMTGHATRRSLDEARMAGVTEFLAKPINARGVMHRINEVINNPRDFVRVGDYFGPCRRRRIDHDFTGDERRGVQPTPTVLGGEAEVQAFDPEECY
ncbi:two-component system response regulator [Caulobacter sp. D4A]|uniref:response regulator n=1 Tax=unclassified Caulobacter TaxID=2648921 RepID=UPI000D725C09|nr:MULTISPECIES: response regulator [unclassified Caulobacter]PXA91911.1 two-component system response regulator [Caulobacter sp. D5]PXA93050.1 two-component system response regulator [Caulobacter sp. D4A]